MLYEVITSTLVPYAFIGYDHPEILLNVKKDADIWDMMLNTRYMKVSHEAISEYLGIKNGRITSYNVCYTKLLRVNELILYSSAQFAYSLKEQSQVWLSFKSYNLFVSNSITSAT